jgi:hypothetical protein
MPGLKGSENKYQIVTKYKTIKTKMKKHLLIPVAALLFMGACKPKDDPTPQPTPDTTPPSITLKGRTNDTVSLNSTYVDPGATASDNVSGDVSASIVASGNVNEDLVGNYLRFYNVKDAAGNVAAQVTRFVHVRNDADYLVGAYNANVNCGSTQTSNNLATNVSVSNSVNNRIVVSGLGGLLPGVSPEVDVTGSNLNIPYKNNNGEVYSGTGTIDASKKKFTLNYLITKSNGSWNCTTVYTKQ